jgi:hypothetical protein
MSGTGVREFRDHPCEHRAGNMTRTITIIIVETYAATILVAGLPAYIDDPHPGVAQMGGEPFRAYELRAIDRRHDVTCEWGALMLAASKSNGKALFLLLALL